MSFWLFDRMRRLKIELPSHISNEELDKTFEDVTGKECDDAARELPEAEFRKAVGQSIEVLLKKKKVATVIA